jgi:hypothetical protein
VIQTLNIPPSTRARLSAPLLLARTGVRGTILGAEVGDPEFGVVSQESDEATAVSRTIHVACGDCALTYARSIARKDAVYLRDDLSCGPLAAMDDLDGWIAMRQAYWDHPEGEPTNTRTRRRRSKYATRDRIIGSLDRLGDADEVVIWLGTGLAEQLALAWMPQLLRAIGGRLESLQVVQFERTGSGKAIVTVNALSSEELQNRPSPHPIDGDGLAYLDKAWRAASASVPAALIDFIEQVPSPLPLLRGAFERILWRYPDVRTGINLYDALLLASTRDNGPKVARVIGCVMSTLYFEDNECAGDNWLFWRLRRLADPTLPHPAVALTGERISIRGTEAHLTQDGERFLKAASNFVEMNGIDDWACGVHLDSRAGEVWFHQDGKILRS